MAGNRTITSVLRAETAAYQRDMQAAAKATEAVGDAGVKSSAKGTSALSQLSASARQNSAEWTELGQTLTGIGAIMAGIGGSVLAVGISYNTLQQQSRAALTSLTGSAEAANAQMDKLDAFAVNSPFAKDVFIRAQQQMLGFGIEAQKVIPYLDAIQNAVAAAGGSNHDIAELSRIMSQISASAKITATDLREFGNRGIDAATLIGSQMGMTGAEIRDSITAGTLDAGEALDALAAGMSERFEGAADGVKDTMVGAFDRVKAAFRDLSSELVSPLVDPQGGGFLVDAANGVADFMRNLQGLPGPIKAAVAALFGLTTAATLGGGALLLLTPRIVATRAAAATLAPQFLAAGKAMLTVQNAIKGMTRTGLMLGGMALAATGVAEKTGLANTASMALMGTIAGPWGAAIGGGIGLLADLGAANKSAKDSMQQFFEVASDDAFLSGMQANLAKMQESVDSLGGMFDDAAMEGLKQAGQDVYDQLEKVGQLLAGGPENNWTPSIEEMDKAFSDLLPVAQELFPEIVNGAQDLAKLDVSQLNEVKAAVDMSEEARLTSEAFEDAISAASGAGQAFLTLGESLNDSKVSLGDWIGELEAQNKALKNFTSNIETLAKRGLDGGLLEELINKGPEGVQRLEQLANASDDTIKRANTAFKRGQIGLEDYNAVVNDVLRNVYGLDSLEVAPDTSKGKKAMDGLMDSATATGKELDATDKKNVHPFINTSSIDAAIGAATAIGIALDRAARPRTAWIGVAGPGVGAGALGRADGGTITRYDVGGTVAGQREPYGDKVLAYLAPGEEVISNRFGQADRHRDLLKAINAGSFANGGTIASFANGGTAGGGVTRLGAQMALLATSLKKLRQQLKQSEKALDSARRRRDDLRATRDAMADAIKSSFMSNLFQQPDSIWGAGATKSPLATLSADVDNLISLNKARRQLVQKGVTGSALDAILTEGSLADAQAMAGWSKADLKAYDAMFNLRESVADQVSSKSAQAAYGKELKTLNQRVKGLRQDNKALQKIVKQAGKNAKAGRRGESARAGRNRR